MDLLFSKYASPYFLLDEMLSAGRLSDFVYSMAETENERKLWDIYLSLVANPYAEVTSFDEFKKKNAPKPADNNFNVEATVKDSYKLLLDFEPNNRG